MSLVSQLLDYLLANNSAPASAERVVFLEETLSPPGRAFYVAEDAIVSYVTASGDVVNDKPVFAGSYHPIKVERFTAAATTQGETMKVWVLW